LTTALLVSLFAVGPAISGFGSVLAQATAPQTPPSGGMGVNTGAAHAAVLDEQHRPITAGGFVKAGPIYFEDATERSGLAKWHHQMGTPAKRSILETVGSGVALFDYDNDGWLDIYLVNGSTYPALTGKGSPPPAALFHNNHDGTFTDVAAKAGVTNERWGVGVAVADYDNDGWPDIFVSNFGANRLFHNNHDGTFTDVAERAGVTVNAWSTGATWGDYDGDGRVDLFVPGYVDVALSDADPDTPPKAGNGMCQFRGQPVMCGPRGLHGAPDHLFHNNGDGTFTDVSAKAGVADKERFYGLASLFIDVNGDGRPDLLVADDSTPNYLYLNKGDGTFEDASFASGYALNESGRETASMGIASGDYAHNGRIDLYNTTFSDDYNPLYRNDGEGNFTDISYQMGIAEPTIPFLGWGTSFLDADNDGWLDLLVANGHVYPQVDNFNWGTTWKQRPLFFRNVNGKFAVVAPAEGSALATLGVGRGLAVGDLFNRGKLDAVINNMDGIPTLLRNVSDDKNHWVGLKLIGGPHSPRDAIGAIVYLTSRGVKQRGDVISGGSFASSSDPRVHFGLGAATKVDSLEVHWPDGVIESFAPVSIDTYTSLTEGRGKALP
jgi:enediyne biosynthesis protein E4